METTQTPNDRRFFWRVWLLASVVGWSLLTVGLGIRMVTSALTDQPVLMGLSSLLAFVACSAVISVGQSFALRTYITNPRKWAKATFLGWMLVGLVSWSAIIVQNELPLLVPPPIIALLVIPPIIVGAMQWFSSLEHLPKRSGCKWIVTATASWIIGLLLGGGIFTALAIGIADITIHAVDLESVVAAVIVMVFPGAVAGICSGGITGAVLMGLLGEKRTDQTQAIANAA